MDKVELEKAQDRLRLCGRNRGDHAYVPVIKRTKQDNKTKEKVEYISMFMCIRCFLRVSNEEIVKLFPNDETTSSSNLDTIGCTYLS